MSKVDESSIPVLQFSPSGSVIQQETQPAFSRSWQRGIALRWTAAGMLGAERQFRRIIGYQQLATLALAIERDRAPAMTTKEW